MDYCTVHSSPRCVCCREEAMGFELQKEQSYIKAYHKQKICQDGEQESN